MAAGFLSKPGTEHGPCEECKHTDCAMTRRIAESDCEICGEPIGYEKRFVKGSIPVFKGTRPDRFQHEVCAHQQQERGE